MNDIIVCGGDKRFYHMCCFLVDYGFSVKWLFAEKYPSDESFIERESYNISNPYALVLPLPFSRDNHTLNTPFSEKKILISDLDFSDKYTVLFTSDDRIDGINYFKDETVIIDNARLTAVGLLKEIFSYEKEDILGKNALVTGYGRVSQQVCDILMKNGIKVTAAARNESQRHLAATRGISALEITGAAKNLGEYDYVINTVPEKLFEGSDIEKTDRKTVFFELASGLMEKSLQREKTYIDCKGMPGKHTPKSAGRVIADFVSGKLRE